MYIQSIIMGEHVIGQQRKLHSRIVHGPVRYAALLMCTEVARLRIGSFGINIRRIPSTHTTFQVGCYRHTSDSASNAGRDGEPATYKPMNQALELNESNKHSTCNNDAR